MNILTQKTGAVITVNKREVSQFIELLLFLHLSEKPVKEDLVRILSNEELLEKIIIIDPTFGVGFQGNEHLVTAYTSSLRCYFLKEHDKKSLFEYKNEDIETIVFDSPVTDHSLYLKNDQWKNTFERYRKNIIDSLLDQYSKSPEEIKKRLQRIL